MAAGPKDRIRIARIIARLNVGGPAIHTILLSEGLRGDRFDTRLVVGKPDAEEGDMLPLARERKLNIEYIPELGREIGLRDITAFFKLFRFLRAFKPDIVHTHTAKAGTLGRLAAILSGVPVKVHTFHGHVFDGYFNPAKAGFFLLIERVLGNFTDKVLVVSDGVRKEIVSDLRVINGEKCLVVPLGLELDRFLGCEALRGRFRKDLGIDKDTLLVGIVGRLVPIKNHEMFLEAANRIKAGTASGVKVKFVIIGDGECRRSIENRIAELGLKDSVIMTGWAKDLAAVYADLDVVGLTSLNEGTPVSIIEAMASARPVVATDVGGVRDVVADGLTGFLVKSGDAEGFAARLMELLEDAGKRASFGARGRQAVKDRYSKERLVRDMEDLYGSLYKRKTG